MFCPHCGGGVEVKMEMCKMKMLAGILLVLVLAGLSAIVQAQSDDGLVAEWHFDEGSGNDGAIYGAKWVEGKFGKALEFDGVDDYVKVPDDDSLDVTTLFLWRLGYTLQRISAILREG
jgi:hypothetical protein